MTGRGEVAYREDRVPVGFVVRLAVGTVVITLALCIVTYLLLRLREDQLGAKGKFPELARAPHEVANVRQALFQGEGAGLSLRQAQRAALDGYRWLDRSRGLLSIPVDDAIQMLYGDPSGGTAP